MQYYVLLEYKIDFFIALYGMQLHKVHIKLIPTASHLAVCVVYLCILSGTVSQIQMNLIRPLLII